MMDKLRLGSINFFILISILSCAQTKTVVDNVYAFNTIRLPGNIQQGENSNNISDTTYFIYVETGEQIDWKKAYRNGKCFDLITTPIKNNSLIVGKNENGEDVIINRAKDKTLWHLLLQQTNKCEAQRNIENDGFIIEGYLKKIKISQVINKVVMLYKPPTV